MAIGSNNWPNGSGTNSSQPAENDDRSASGHPVPAEMYGTTQSRCQQCSSLLGLDGHLRRQSRRLMGKLFDRTVK